MRTTSRTVAALLLSSPILLLGCDNMTQGQGGATGGGAGTPAGTSTGGAPSGGSPGSGGKAGTGGTASTGGSATGTGGAVSGGTSGSATGGSSSPGTTIGSGGAASSGGRTGAGGATASGGGPGTGGSNAGGGTSAVAGRTGAGGALSTGGTVGAGGTPGAGGRSASGGTPGTGGAAGGGGIASTGGTLGTGGTASTGGATCDATWNPPDTANGNTNLVAGLDAVWSHSGATIMAAPNLKIHQIMANQGALSYCARWQSTTPINAADRKAIETLIGKCDKQWTDKLAGWGCWPYPAVTVKVVLWAVTDASVLTEWSDAEGKVVVNSDASCPTDCGPWDPKKSFSSCSTTRYDEFFWLDGSLTTYTGWGSATGFYMGADTILKAARAGANTETIVAHEMGHSHGLDDFYDWQPTGWTHWIMNSGTSSVVTDTDGWMLRDVWRHVRSKYGYPGP